MNAKLNFGPWRILCEPLTHLERKAGASGGNYFLRFDYDDLIQLIQQLGIQKVFSV